MERRFHQCSFCGERFTTEGKIFGIEHQCSEMSAVVERWRAQEEIAIRRKIKLVGKVAPENEGLVIFAACTEAMANAINYYAPAALLKFKRKAKADKCGPKCWAAKAENCSCECEGINHGIGRAPSTV